MNIFGFIRHTHKKSTINVITDNEFAENNLISNLECCKTMDDWLQFCVSLLSCNLKLDMPCSYPCYYDYTFRLSSCNIADCLELLHVTGLSACGRNLQHICYVHSTAVAAWDALIGLLPSRDRTMAQYPPIFFLITNQTHLIIQIYSVIKLYMFRESSLPIIRSFLLYIRHC
jgi:hypothetical protein